MELSNSKELIENLVDMIKNESEEKPIMIKNLYHCLKNLNYILFLDDEGEVYWRTGSFKSEEERIYATVFVDERVFDDWRDGNDHKYQILNFEEFLDLLGGIYNANNTPVYSTIILDWNEPVTYLKIDAEEIQNFQSHVVINNSNSKNGVYVSGTPSNVNEEFIEALKDEFEKNEYVTSAEYTQVLTPPQDNENIIESFEPNKTYFAVVYSIDDRKCLPSDCLKLEERCHKIAKEFVVDLLIVLKVSQVGQAIASNENEFYRI